METFSYLNGAMIPASEAKIHYTDLGFQRGFGIFDYASVYNSRIFHFQDYLSRFHQSAKALGLSIQLSDAKIEEICYALLKKSKITEGAVRFMLTGGASNIDLELKHQTHIISADNLPQISRNLYDRGVHLMTVVFQRELPEVKTLNYMNAIRLEPLKKKNKADGILYHSQFGVTECPRNNFFIFMGNVLVTPKEHVLKGITRKVILQLAKQKFDIEERKIDFEELKLAEEAFFTSTRYKIMPVSYIDGLPVGNGLPGKNTRYLMQKFMEYLGRY